MQDIRWHQRLRNFQNALQKLEQGVILSRARLLSDLEKQGLVKAFEFTHELAWNVIKDYFEFQGATHIMGSRDAAREAFNKGLIQNGEVWMEMIKSRNLTSHTCNKNISDEIVEKVKSEYVPEFLTLKSKMLSLC
jgi:nucleotidyltransferase substrate binding protein (TIGR01987 family)